jgi:Na+-driven multidrug efflux pump
MDSQQAASNRPVFLLSAISGLLGGLCCLTPIVMVLLGLSTVAAANSLGNWLYGDYKWHFRALAFLFLVLAGAVYFRRQGVCSLDQARRNRNRILNTTLLGLSAAVTVYVFWTYVVLHYAGIAAGLPWAQWDESWAIPASAGLAGFTGFLWWLQRARRPAPSTRPATAASWSGLAGRQ